MTTDAKKLNSLPATENPVLGISIDGNSVTLTEVSVTADHRIIIESSAHSEESELLETIKLLRHPIHNELDSVEYVNKKKFKNILDIILKDYGNDRKLVVSMAQECFRRWEKTIESGSAAASEVYFAGVKKCLHSNPYGYPILFGFSRMMEQMNCETYRFWSARFDDFLHTAEAYRPVKQNFQGAVSPIRALTEVLPRIIDVPADQPITVVHPGKLRTYYIGILDGIVQFTRAIPVGISRDGPEYFKTLSPNLKKIDQLINEYGSLIMSADTTPSAFFRKELQSPQSEATRFAHQIAEFASKVQCDLWNKFHTERMPKIYLSGSVSRLRGFQEYMHEKTGMPIDYLSKILSQNIEYNPSDLDSCITDYLIPIGNCLAYQRRDESRSGLILTDHRPKSLKYYDNKDGFLENNQMYVVEYPREILISSEKVSKL